MADYRSIMNFTKKIKVCETSAFATALEGKGPSGKYLDAIVDEKRKDGQTWEQNEIETVKQTVKRLLEKSEKSDGDIGVLLGGDLMNQCTSCGYGLCDFDIPYLGLYGACSTFAEGLLIGGCLVQSGFTDSAVATASSHYCTAERQFRFPLSYGVFPQGTSQHTVTGCGAAYITETQDEKGIFLRSAATGFVIDRGITNASNMGAAMSTAAADTIMRFLKHEDKTLSHYDLVATGDLGEIGLKMTKDMLYSHGYDDNKGALNDCGLLIYDIKNQDVGCGGSGCGCSAVTFCSYIYDMMKKGLLKRVLLIGTGAMMSPSSLLQGMSIPAVAHLVEFEGVL